MVLYWYKYIEPEFLFLNEVLSHFQRPLLRIPYHLVKKKEQQKHKSLEFKVSFLFKIIESFCVCLRCQQMYVSLVHSLAKCTQHILAYFHSSCEMKTPMLFETSGGFSRKHIAEFVRSDVFTNDKVINHFQDENWFLFLLCFNCSRKLSNYHNNLLLIMAESLIYVSN